MTAYSEALEQQVRMLRLMAGPSGDAYVDAAQPTASPADRRRFRELAVTMLARAESYFWDQQLAGVVAEASASLPDGTTLVESMVPSYAGWFWFAQPVELGQPDFAKIRAISWLPLDDQSRGGLALQVVWWVHLPDFGTVPAASGPWFLGDPLDGFEQRRLASDGPTGPRYVAVMRFLASAFAFVSQGIVTARPVRAERHAAKRVAREGWSPEPLIRVIQLRRAERAAHEPSDGSAPREWSCQWVVRGHWRQQVWGEGRKGRRPIWITPYVKGPDDKPLKTPRATVFAVVR